MPSFLRDLRRKSKSFRGERPATVSANAPNLPNGAPLKSPTPGDLPRNKSSSTLNSTYQNSSSSGSKPPSNRGSQSNLKANGTNAAPPVPVRPPVNTKRYSINGGGSPTNSERAISPFAPRVLSISDNSWVNQKVLLIFGQIGDPSSKLLGGTVVVNHHNDTIAPTSWEVSDSYFKALVYLQPGPNRIRLDFYSPKVSQSNTSIPAHFSNITINYLPVTSSPPLHLAIILAKDSPEVYDAVPGRIEREGNGLETAKRKYRTAAYLWQAFTGEQMYRQGLGRRCFRLEEDWQRGTLSMRDYEMGVMRSEAKVHIIRSDKTLQEIQDLNVAQQYPKASRAGDLYGIAADAVKQYFDIQPGETRYVAAMFLDSHWDTQAKTIRGHAALGGGDGSLQLAIFGSHALQSYPASLDEVLPAFTDCTPTDTQFVANDCNESGSNWEAANIGIGAHMHEVGHLFGCPHQAWGVMARDYTRLNRTFVCHERFCTRTKSQGQMLCLPHDECAWHPLDCLRFRYHPAFAQAHDPPPPSDTGVRVWTVENGTVLAMAPTGIAWLEIYGESDNECKAWIDYVSPESPDATRELPRQLTLSESDLRARLPSGKRDSKLLKVEVHSAGNGKHVIEDFAALAKPKNSRVKLPNGRYGFRGGKLGYSQMEGSQPQEIIFESALNQNVLMLSIKVYHDWSVNGIEFFYEDGRSQLLGNRGGKGNGSEFPLDFRRAEVLMGFHLRAGLWIDGIQILTSLGRKSEIFGKPNGGSGHTLIPPRSYHIVGITGSAAQCLDGFQPIIAR